MSNPLAQRSVSDGDAVAATRSLAMPSTQRVALWRERWNGSADLQAEFHEAAVYASYMEGLTTGRVKSISSLPR